MKKMLFSAIALIAFTATSMAAEGKKERKEEKEKTQKVVKERDCKSEKTIAYLAALGDGFSQEAASGMSYNIYFWCLGSMF